MPDSKATRVWVCAVAALAIALITLGNLSAQTPPTPAQPGASSGQDTILLTVFFRHDQSKPLEEINAQLKRQGYYDKFPPPGIEVVSWYVMMGIGQVVTLRVPASRLREVNRAIETSAWGAYRTEFYPTYDYKAVAEEERRKNRQ
jgi:hypothetical protein